MVGAEVVGAKLRTIQGIRKHADEIRWGHSFIELPALHQAEEESSRSSLTIDRALRVELNISEPRILVELDPPIPARFETSGGKESGGKAAAKRYSVSDGKLGELTERRGDPMTAKKMDASLVPHTRREIEWIETTVKAAIKRVAEVAAGVTVKQIEMSDLPSL